MSRRQTPTHAVLVACGKRLDACEYLPPESPVEEHISELEQPSWRTADSTLTVRSSATNDVCRIAMVRLAFPATLVTVSVTGGPQVASTCSGAATTPWIQSMDDEGEMCVTCQVSTHAVGDIWTLAAHPIKRTFASGGDDGVGRIVGRGFVVT
jgi:hypothetical protein